MSLDINDAQTPAGGSAEGSAQSRRQASTGADQHEENNFEALLAAHEGRTQSFSEGEVIRGKVIAISGGGVIVDVGFKSEGIIPIAQFTDEQGRVSIKVGDPVDVFLEQTEDSEGYVVLSREKAERMKIWDEIERAYR